MSDKRWSYKVISLPYKAFSGGQKKAEAYQGILNQEGMRGWELVNVTVDSGGAMKAFFKK